MALLFGVARAGDDVVKRWDRGGIIVYAAPAPGAPDTWVTAVLRAGRNLAPPNAPGAADLCAAAVGEALRGAGMRRVAVEVDPFSASFTVRLPAAGLERGLGALGGALLTPPDDKALLARALKTLEADAPKPPPSALDTARDALMMRLLGPARVGRMPNAAELRALTAGNIQAFHRHFYVRNNLWLAVASAAESAEVDEAIHAAFKPWRRRAVEIPPPAGVEEAQGGWSRVEAPAGDVVAVGGLGPGRWDPERYASAVLVEVTRQQLAEAGGGAEVWPGVPPVWWAWTQGEGASQGGMQATLKAVTTVGDGDVVAARERLQAEVARSVRSPASLAARYARAEAMGYPGDHWKQDIKQLGRVSGAKVRRLARSRYKAEAIIGVELSHGGASPSDVATEGKP